jgi:hypothetical protein
MNLDDHPMVSEERRLYAPAYLTGERIVIVATEIDQEQQHLP